MTGHARARSARLPVGTVGTLLGREEQLQAIRGAVRTRAMIEFTGERGSGKTALLQAVAPDAYIRVGGTPFADFLQDLVVEFRGRPPGGGRIPAPECFRVLSEVRAVIALDDVSYSPGEIGELRRALAGCAVLVGAREPVVGPMGHSYRLAGLSEPDAMALLARDTGRLIHPGEVPAVQYLVAAVEGSPLALRQAAALVRLRRYDLPALAAALSTAAQQAPAQQAPGRNATLGPPGHPDPPGHPGPSGNLGSPGHSGPCDGSGPWDSSTPGDGPAPCDAFGTRGHPGSPDRFGPGVPPEPEERGQASRTPGGQASRTPGGALLEELAISGLGPDALRVLAVLALAEGCYLPERLLSAMAGAGDGSRHLALLAGLGLAERRGDLAGPRSGSPEPSRRLIADAVDPRLAHRALVTWFGTRDPDDAEVRPALGVAAALLRQAVHQGDWPAVHRLAAAVEPALCLHGHWRSWRSTLEAGAEAAAHIGAPDVIAYTAHQLGTLHLLEGRVQEARAELARALDLRTRLADREGAAVTRRNAELAAPAPAPAAALPAVGRGRRGATRLMATVAVLAAGVGVSAGVGALVTGGHGDTPTTTGGHGGSSGAADSDPDASAAGSAEARADDPAAPVAVPKATVPPAAGRHRAPAATASTPPATSSSTSSSTPSAAPVAVPGADGVPGPTSLPSASRRPTSIAVAGSRG
ncbi:P-loop NTPase family protein [Actinacidiphila yeochonensis]|uniref:hypothetical protein n=1 Tax=Actinacidiphila yeochonensis TaxID=89050 RepID=UPI0012FF3B8F|nr:hypothetical protein [Actinacidiphila yeochonensis]